MQVLKQTLALGLIAAAVSSAVHADNDFLAARGVFVMTNDADANEVIAYERNRDGALGSPHRYLTGGRGSGGTVDPLASQGSLTLSSDGNWLLAANAGSGSVSVFRVFEIGRAHV